MASWPVERCEALRLALGACGALPREVGTLIPPQGCPLVPWRLPPLHRLARFARDWQTSDALRRENAEPWQHDAVHDCDDWHQGYNGHRAAQSNDAAGTGRDADGKMDPFRAGWKHRLR